MFKPGDDPGIFNGGGENIFFKKKSGGAWTPTHGQMPCLWLSAEIRGACLWKIREMSPLNPLVG